MFENLGFSLPTSNKFPNPEIFDLPLLESLGSRLGYGAAYMTELGGDGEQSSISQYFLMRELPIYVMVNLLVI